jgi:hypothetical protein
MRQMPQARFYRIELHSYLDPEPDPGLGAPGTVDFAKGEVRFKAYAV